MAARWQIEGVIKTCADALSRRKTGPLPGDEQLITESCFRLGTLLLEEGLLDQEALADLLQVCRGDGPPPPWAKPRSVGDVSFAELKAHAQDLHRVELGQVAMLGDLLGQMISVENQLAAGAHRRAAERLGTCGSIPGEQGRSA